MWLLDFIVRTCSDWNTVFIVPLEAVEGLAFFYTWGLLSTTPSQQRFYKVTLKMTWWTAFRWLHPLQSPAVHRDLEDSGELGHPSRLSLAPMWLCPVHKMPPILQPFQSHQRSQLIYKTDIWRTSSPSEKLHEDHDSSTLHIWWICDLWSKPVI